MTNVGGHGWTAETIRRSEDARVLVLDPEALCGQSGPWADEHQGNKLGLPTRPQRVVTRKHRSLPTLASSSRHPHTGPLLSSPRRVLGHAGLLALSQATFGFKANSKAKLGCSANSSSSFPSRGLLLQAPRATTTTAGATSASASVQDPNSSRQAANEQGGPKFSSPAKGVDAAGPSASRLIIIPSTTPVSSDVGLEFAPDTVAQASEGSVETMPVQATRDDSICSAVCRSARRTKTGWNTERSNHQNQQCLAFRPTGVVPLSLLFPSASAPSTPRRLTTPRHAQLQDATRHLHAKSCKESPALSRGPSEVNTHACWKKRRPCTSDASNRAPKTGRERAADRQTEGMLTRIRPKTSEATRSSSMSSMLQAPPPRATANEVPLDKGQPGEEMISDVQHPSHSHVVLLSAQATLLSARLKPMSARARIECTHNRIASQREECDGSRDWEHFRALAARRVQNPSLTCACDACFALRSARSAHRSQRGDNRRNARNILASQPVSSSTGQEWQASRRAATPEGIEGSSRNSALARERDRGGGPEAAAGDWGQCGWSQGKRIRVGGQDTGAGAHLRAGRRGEGRTKEQITVRINSPALAAWHTAQTDEDDGDATVFAPPSDGSSSIRNRHKANCSKSPSCNTDADSSPPSDAAKMSSTPCDSHSSQAQAAQAASNSRASPSSSTTSSPILATHKRLAASSIDTVCSKVYSFFERAGGRGVGWIADKLPDYQELSATEKAAVKDFLTAVRVTSQNSVFTNE